MENFFDTVFYNLYLLYTKVIPDWDPLFTVYSLIGFHFSMPFVISFYMILLIFVNLDLGAGMLLVISSVFIYFSYLYYAKSRRYSKIIRSKPYVVNRTFSKIATFMFIIVNLIITGAGLGYFGYNIKEDKIEKGEVVKILDISLRRGMIYKDYKSKKKPSYSTLDEMLEHEYNNK